MMIFTIDGKDGTITLENGRSIGLFSEEGYGLLSDLWTRVGWVQKYSYAFTWMGRPIIQMPEDMIRIQEAIYVCKPDVIIETGVAHGGSLVYYASILNNLGGGRVIGVDIEIRPHNRKAIEEHWLSPSITLIEGSSISEDTIDRVRRNLKDGEKVMVILDSNHKKAHVLQELTAYSQFVTRESLLLVQDSIMAFVAGMPRTGEDWSWNNPLSAIEEFLEQNRDFAAFTPSRPFDESLNTTDCTYHHGGWLRRVG